MRILTLLACVAFPALGAGKATLTGKVTDSAGKAVEHATVLVWHAGPKVGYSTFCPSCYADCGKRSTTDAGGGFRIGNLDPDLWFELLVVRDGYTPAFVKKVDPLNGAAPDAVLSPRPPVNDPARVLRGRVVDAHGRPLRDAAVQPQGIQTERNGQPASIYGTIQGLDPVAVTNAKGEFELAHSEPVERMLLLVEARGMAPKLAPLPTGLERQTITVTDGAVIRGRLVEDGKPVAGAELGLAGRQRGWGANLKIIGDPYQEVRIGTQADGTFAITNVPAPGKWYLYPKMDSVAKRGAARPIEVATAKDLEEIELGDIPLKPGHRLRGKVVLNDGQPLAAGMRVFITPGCRNCMPGYESFSIQDSQTVTLGADGAFEFTGLADGPYQLTVSVKGYALAEPPSPLAPLADDPKMDPAAKKRMEEFTRKSLAAFNTIELRVEKDIDAMVIPLAPKK